MAKRFTDSEKWKKVWFRKLPSDMKLFWVYICDNCSIAGIWEADFELASFFIGCEVLEPIALRYMEKQVKVIGDRKWQIVDFVPFQYGKLVPNNNLHRSVINSLESLGASEGLVSPKAGDKVKVKVIKERIVKENQHDFESVWIKYPKMVGKKDAERHFRASVKTEQDFADIQTALENYKKSDTVAKNFIQNGSTWFNNWRDWIIPPNTPKDPVIENYMKG